MQDDPIHGGILNRHGQDHGPVLGRQGLWWGIVAQQVDPQDAMGGVIGHDGLHVGGSRNPDHRLRMKQAHRIGEEFPGFSQVVLACSGGIRGTGKGEDGALAGVMDQDGRADRGFCTHRPIRGLLAFQLAGRAEGLP